MGIICLLRHHAWKFSYNHGVPLGTDMDTGEVLKKFKTGEVFAVDACTRCKRQSRMVNGKRVMLTVGLTEEP